MQLVIFLVILPVPNSSLPLYKAHLKESSISSSGTSVKSKYKLKATGFDSTTPLILTVISLDIPSFLSSVGYKSPPLILEPAS